MTYPFESPLNCTRHEQNVRDENPEDTLTPIASGHHDVSCRPGVDGDLCNDGTGPCGARDWCCQFAKRQDAEGAVKETGLCATSLLVEVDPFGCVALE
jgi:hypothetical protein